MSSKKKQNKNTNKNKIKKDKENLNKMLKDYQNFCQKFFGNSTLISSMERMNNIIEEENLEENDENENKIKNNSNEDLNKEFSLTMIKNDDYDFCFNVNFDSNFEKFFKLSNKNFLGFEKNDKNDYERRLKKISKKNNKNNIKNNEKNDDKNNNKNNNKNDNKNNNKNNNNKNENSIENYNDFENEENDKFFDENTDKLINEINKAEQATKIQIYFKSQKCPKLNKDKIFFGFDKSKKFIIWIFIDKISDFKNKDSIIFSLAFKIYSFETKILTYEKHKIKDLLNIDSINKNKINDKIEIIINKVLKEKNNKNKKNKENSFEDFEMNKNKNNNSIDNYNDFKDSISSIENVEYENI